ncbi:PQQ-binding-like beta-propeller repeat protein [Actinoplanes sp. NEAU-A12]|uniref:PQQ-binding-like beta-propeller repeat protein n=1 Tax=Actinoplanes sandaracinus TaxID=3045177 RepID=A0ABT6WE87_9ACTN|nr:PQQ-binding-like beta-propeller repeat protein [Actinoplanes sandaracinus]MDI6098044.1 PQQ-binding-like beta-propeller repeat protein [Actinoplanes sandaracinus]
MVIDLDVVPPSREPARTRPRFPARRALVLVVLLALLPGAAEVPPRVRDLPLVAATSSASGTWLLTGATLYSTHARAGGRMDVVARSLTAGEVLWQRDIPWWSGIPALTEAGPMLLVTGPAGVGTRILDGRTGEDGVDPATYTVALPVGDRIALYGDGAGGRLALYDPAQGRIAWQRRFGRPLRAAAATGAHLITVDDTGVAATFALNSGEPGATTGQAIPGGSAPVVRILGSRAYLLGDRTVTSVTVPNLTGLWTTALPLPRVAVACGARVCVSGAAGVSAINPETGRVAWNNLDWTGGEAGLVRAADGHGVLVDPETGGVRADLGPGLPVGDLLLRAGPDGLSVVEWATGQIRGRLPGVTPSGCRRTGDHLACQQVGGPVQVWRLLHTPAWYGQ